MTTQNNNTDQPSGCFQLKNTPGDKIKSQLDVLATAGWRIEERLSFRYQARPFTLWINNWNSLPPKHQTFIDLLLSDFTESKQIKVQPPKPDFEKLYQLLCKQIINYEEYEEYNY